MQPNPDGGVAGSMHLPHRHQIFSLTQNEVSRISGYAEHYRPAKPIELCQWEIAARMKGQTVLGEKKHLGCPKCCLWGFGLEKPESGAEIKSHAKYTRDPGAG